MIVLKSRGLVSLRDIADNFKAQCSKLYHCRTQATPSSLLEYIFEPFHQEKMGFIKGGTGLRLAIAYRQV